MKQKRILEFDIIRAIATITIVILHYNALYYFIENPRYDLMIFGCQFSNIYLGSWGVSLFFILSGASLMYVYGDANFKITKFYKKRFLGIYPKFWIAYFFGFLLLFWINKTIPFQNVAKWKFIFTILGIDGTMATFTSTFYILGEWFLACIICLYIVFPIFRYLINKFPKITLLIIITIFCIMEFIYSWNIPKDVIFLTRLPEFCFGMYFVKYIKKIKWPIALISLTIIIINWIVKPDFIPQDIQVLYVGIASFNTLIFICKYIKRFKSITKLSKFISKYSYAIFLTHHVIITQIMNKFDYLSFSIWGSISAFLLCLTLIFIASILLYKFEKKILITIKT